MKTAIEIFLEQRAKKIMAKGASMSNIDIYNLCILNRMDKIEQEKEKEETSNLKTKSE